MAFLMNVFKEVNDCELFVIKLHNFLTFCKIYNLIQMHFKVYMFSHAAHSHSVSSIHPYQRLFISSKVDFISFRFVYLLMI